MSHTKYHTPAIILRSYHTKESSKVGILYTKDFGLLYVNAQSIRLQKAKMRSFFLDHSLVSVDIIRGRGMWRLTGIDGSVSSLSFVETPWYPMIHKISLLVERLCQGEDENSDLWKHLATLYTLINTKTLYEKHFELVFVINILHALGYWSHDNLVTEHHDVHNPDVLKYVQNNKTSLTKQVNEVLAMTQL